MTWSELLKKTQERHCASPFNNQRDEQLKWIQEATEFGNKYNVIIRLKEYTNSNGEMLLLEMTHRDDPKNTVIYKKTGGTYISTRDRISNYFEHLYEKLPQVRRNRRLNND